MNTPPSTSNTTLKRKAKKKTRSASSGPRKLLNSVDMIRQKLLLSEWKELKASGVRLLVADIWRQQKCSPSLPYQYLNGGIPLNVEWMMIFAQYMKLTPQEIWGKHWPYQKLTPIFCPDGFESVVFHFGQVLMVYRRTPPAKIPAVARALASAVIRLTNEVREHRAS